MRRGSIALALALAVVSCSFSRGSHVGTLQIGHTVTLTNLGLALTFEAVTEDSRCPTGAQCITAGRASITVKASTEGLDPSTLTLTIPGSGELASYAGYTITLTTLEPYPTLDHRPEQDEYIATIHVQPSAADPKGET